MSSCFPPVGTSPVPLLCVSISSQLFTENGPLPVSWEGPAQGPVCLGSHEHPGRSPVLPCSLVDDWGPGPDGQESVRGENLRCYSLGKPTRSWAGSLGGDGVPFVHQSKASNELVCTFWPLKAT